MSVPQAGRRPFPSVALPLAAVGALLLAGCAGLRTPPAPLKLTVLHTNDHHGRFWANADGEYGLAARKTLIDQVRAEVAAAGGQLLLLDGGDVNTGVPESDLQQAEPDFKGMAAIGYDAMAVGNHEFDKPPAVLQRQRQWAGFPLLSANIRDAASGQRVFEPYRIFERGGRRIAVIGLTTDDTPRLVMPANVAGLRFSRPADEARSLVGELRGQVDMVIAATHMGHYVDGKAGVNAPGDVELARAVPGLDLIVGGHSQNPVCMLAENRRNEAYKPGEPCAPDRQNGAWIVQAHEWGKYVGRADFVIDGGKVELQRYQLLPVNLKVKAADGKKVNATALIAEDPALRALLEPFQQAGQRQLGVAVGQSDGVLDGDRTRVRAQPTTLGGFIASAMMARTGADLAVMNSGGVRDSLPAGVISYRDILKVQPFANTVCTVDLSGAELQTWLAAAAKMTPGSGAFPQTAGLRLRIAGGVIESLSIGGQPVDPQRRYRLAINNFMAAGGDGYPRLDQHPGFVNTGFNDAEVLRGYLAERSPLRVADFEPGDAVQRR
ncbi:bifunctional UDP-sugar hydrolase/5'-nucleotidase UshA [Pseudaquabacterium rugosum]|uniref:Bifunctional UDP-sugar hydrolase/5'-nucleotidase UshA n=1 Tax=Pseudaquabacterium rugosum TaxID=2984194 RepID=A0ABU9BCN3_9BURK